LRAQARAQRLPLHRGAPAESCSSIDANVDGQVTVDEVIAAVGAALRECG
jgi:hypothetical protein